QSQSQAALRDRRRRKHLMEGSFADAANAHGFKRARWRGLWRQQIQNHLIAVCQNLRILVGKNLRKPSAAMALVLQRYQPSEIGYVTQIFHYRFDFSKPLWN